MQKNKFGLGAVSILMCSLLFALMSVDKGYAQSLVPVLVSGEFRSQDIRSNSIQHKSISDGLKNQLSHSTVTNISRGRRVTSTSNLSTMLMRKTNTTMDIELSMLAEEVKSEGDIETPSTDSNHNEIYFVPSDGRGGALFYKNVVKTGITFIGLGTVLAISALVVSNVIQIDGSLAGSAYFEPFNALDFLYIIGDIFIVSGASALYVGSTYSMIDGTVEGYKKWKKQQLISGGVTSGIGMGLFATGIAMRSSSGNADFEASDGFLTGVGASLLLAGIPSIFFGLMGVF